MHTYIHIYSYTSNDIHLSIHLSFHLPAFQAVHRQFQKAQICQRSSWLPGPLVSSCSEVKKFFCFLNYFDGCKTKPFSIHWCSMSSISTVAPNLSWHPHGLAHRVPHKNCHIQGIAHFEPIYHIMLVLYHRSLYHH